MRRTGAACVLVSAFAAAVAAQPVADGIVDEQGRRWAREGDERFARDDGARLELVPTSLPCGQQLRVAERPRPEWVSGAYWPVIEVAGVAMVLCVESARGPVLVTARPPPGRQVEAGDFAAPLAQLGALLSPPAELASFPPIASPRPVVRVEGDALTVKLDAGEATLALTVVARGACAHEHLAAMRTVGEPRAERFADGYYPAVARNAERVFGCLDTAEGYVGVAIAPAAAAPALAEVLAEIRRAAVARYQRANVNAVGHAWFLGRGNRQLSSPTETSTGTWKIVDGARFGVAGGEVLISTVGPGAGHTRYVIGVRQGACRGDVPADDELGEQLFPPEAGPVWVDAGETRWRAWTCLAAAGKQVELAVIGWPGSGPPASADETTTLRAMTATIARAYGLDVDGERPPPPRRRGEPDTFALGGFYGGVVTFGDGDGGARCFGGLAGLHYRGGRVDEIGLGSMVDVELGFGDGEAIGELRVGVGVSARASVFVFQLLGGGGLGSTGPGAAVDVFGEAAVTVLAGRSMTSVSALRAIGVGGLDHDRVQLWFMPSGIALPSVQDSEDRTRVGFMLGARYLGYPEGAGDAFLLTFGFGISGTD